MGFLAPLGIAMGAASMVTQGISQYQQGRYNAAVASQQAKQIMIARGIDAEQQRSQFERILGTNRAITGASGVTMEGSPILAEMANIFQFEKDQLIQDYNAKIQAGQAKSQARMSKAMGTAALGTSLLNAGAFATGKISLLTDKKKGIV